jgi:hypothetical protein
MTQPIRFHLDENVAPTVAEGLRRRGADVTTAVEAGLLQATDEQHLHSARENNRVLVTHDEDFLALAKQGVQHARIAYCYPEARSVGQMIAALLLIRDCLTPQDMQDHIEFL